MFNAKLFPFALLAFSQSVLAQQPPSAGSQLQQIPAAPTLPRSPSPQVEVQPGAMAPDPGGSSVKITVKSLNVTGQRAYSESELLALTQFKPGSELSLADLREMASRITAFYRRNGFFVAQAFLPAQDIKDGAVTIAVMEGQYGKVSLDNQARVSDSVASGLLAGLDPGEPITSAPLESRLLRLSDLPGVNVRSTLVPGASPGTSDLQVNLTPGERITGSIDADNAGNRYTGAYRLGATINLNEPLGQGDVATLRVLSSGSGLNYARASYQMQVGKAMVGVAYSGLRYALGREFKSLGAHGSARIASVYGSYPLVRSRSTNVYALLGLDAKTFQDKVDSTGAVSDRKAQVLTAGLHADHRDNFGGGGVSAYALDLSGGRIDLRTPADRAADAATARSNGGFGKLGFSAMRLQSVTDTLSLYGAIRGQVASKNLDVSEKMQLGGMYAVRAYPEGEAYADQGVVLNLEARLLLRGFADRLPGQMHLIGFVDAGSVTTHKNPWTVGPNHRTLSGAGVGVNWTGTNNFVVKAYYAVKLGNEVATSAPDRSGRFWIQAVKYF